MFSVSLVAATESTDILIIVHGPVAMHYSSHWPPRPQPRLTHERFLEMAKDSWMQRDRLEFLKRTHGSSCKIDDLD